MIALLAVGWNAPEALHTETGSAVVDTLRLEDVRAAAAQRDPRALQSAVLERASRLRIEAINSGRLPQVMLVGEGTVQSDVPEVGAGLPGDVRLFSIPKEQYRVEANVEWALYDGRLRRWQEAAERARLNEAVTGVAAALYPVREAASETFFGILMLDAHREAMALNVSDLEARLSVVQVRVREGAVLAAEAAVLEAELIRLRAQVAEVIARRAAAVATLGDLLGLELDAGVEFALPDLEAATEQVTGDDATLNVDRYAELVDRPELRRMSRQSERLRLEARTIGARSRPALSLFGRGGVGRPSPIDFLSDEVQPYGVVGVRLRWTALDWGRVRREAEAVRLQADVVATERDALAKRFARDVSGDVADERRLRTALEEDERAVRLREEAAFVAGRQVDEGVLLPDVYADRLTDLAEARLTLERHRIELARARARILSTLGRFPQEMAGDAGATMDP